MEVTFGSNRKTPLKQLPKTPTAGNLTTASRRATMTGTPLTPINRSNFTPRYSPGFYLLFVTHFFHNFFFNEFC